MLTLEDAFNIKSYIEHDFEMEHILRIFEGLADLDQLADFAREHQLDQASDDVTEVVKMTLIKMFPVVAYRRWPFSFEEFYRMANMANIDLDVFK